LQQFNRHVAERGGSQIPGDVGEFTGEKTGLTVLEFELGGGLAFDFIGDGSGTQRDEKIIVTVSVHEGSVVRPDLYLEDAHQLVLENKVMMALVGDFNFLSFPSAGQHHHEN